MFVVSAVDLSHAPRANLLQNAVSPKGLADHRVMLALRAQFYVQSLCQTTGEFIELFSFRVVSSLRC